MSSPILVVGSVGLDTIHNVDGCHTRVLGGAATYGCISGSFFTKAQLVAVVGTDFPDEAVQLLRERDIDLRGLEIAQGHTFHWEGRYADDFTSRVSLATELNVFADFRPKVPDEYRRTSIVMLGNISPELQLEVLDQVQKPELVLTDTMDYWIRSQPSQLERVLRRSDILVINEEEARELVGSRAISRVAKELLGMGPSIVVIKQGEYGAYMHRADDTFRVTAYPLDDVRDPTGAGDCFAGAFLGCIAGEGDLSSANIRRAVVYGCTVASFCVEGVSVKRLVSAGRHDIELRYRLLQQLTHVPN